MVDTQKISVQRVALSRIREVDFKKIGFGSVYTDHMFMADFVEGEWKDWRIMPYGYFQMSPANPTLHYGHSVFEGMKAFKNEDGEALLFRPRTHWSRMNISAERLCMTNIPEDLFMEGITSLISLDREWIPSEEGASLYIRPLLFSADEYIGVRPSRDFTFMVILSPVGVYYSTPVKVVIEKEYSRSVAGGTGFAKAGGNYAGALYPTIKANKKGYHQLIWTDGQTHQYIEESGTMNVMFVIDNVLITPSLGDTILAGITRDSVLALARHWNMTVEERRVSVKELVTVLENGRVQEAFGTGTAATIAHIEVISHEGKDYTLPPFNTRTFANKVLTELEGIKRGSLPDPFAWIEKV